MSDLGVEPKTYRLKADYSTIELIALELTCIIIEKKKESKKSAFRVY